MLAECKPSNALIGSEHFIRLPSVRRDFLGPPAGHDPTRFARRCYPSGIPLACAVSNQVRAKSPAVQPARLRGRPGLSAAALGAVVGRFASSRRIWSRLDKALLPIRGRTCESHVFVSFQRICPTCGHDFRKYQPNDVEPHVRSRIVRMRRQFWF